MLGAGLGGAIMAWALLGAGAAYTLIVPLGLLAGWWLSSRPRAAVAALLGAVVVFETDRYGFLPVTHLYYVRVGRIAPYDLALLAAVVAVVGEARRRDHKLLGPGRATWPLLLLVAACVFGEVMGRSAGGNQVDALNSLHALAILIVTPFVVVNAIRTPRHLEMATNFGAGLVIFKSLEGLLGWLAGSGRPINGTHLIYYEPAPNFIVVLFLLAVLACVVARYRVPRWAAWLTPLVLATLVLSFRRSFWIAAVLGAVIVLLVASGRRGRPLVLVGGLALVLAVSLALRAGGATDTHNSIVQRASSLSPTQVSASADDRYRLDEQKNVILALRSHPATGLGLGVPWTIAQPLPAVTPDGVYYTHVVVFWYWLKLGPLGVVAYLWLTLSAVMMGMFVWRRYPAAGGRILGLASAATVVGLAVAETTGSFTGVDIRLSFVIGALLGLLAAGARVAAAATGGPARLRSLGGPRPQHLGIDRPGLGHHAGRAQRIQVGQR